jgi:hypothetical protein
MTLAPLHHYRMVDLLELRAFRINTMLFVRCISSCRLVQSGQRSSSLFKTGEFQERACIAYKNCSTRMVSVTTISHVFRCVFVCCTFA